MANTPLEIGPAPTRTQRSTTDSTRGASDATEAGVTTTKKKFQQEAQRLLYSPPATNSDDNNSQPATFKRDASNAPVVAKESAHNLSSGSIVLVLQNPNAQPDNGQPMSQATFQIPVIEKSRTAANASGASEAATNLVSAQAETKAGANLRPAAGPINWVLPNLVAGPLKQTVDSGAGIAASQPAVLLPTISRTTSEPVRQMPNDNSAGPNRTDAVHPSQSEPVTWVVPNIITGPVKTNGDTGVSAPTPQPAEPAIWVLPTILSAPAKPNGDNYTNAAASQAAILIPSATRSASEPVRQTTVDTTSPPWVLPSKIVSDVVAGANASVTASGAQIGDLPSVVRASNPAVTSVTTDGPSQPAVILAPNVQITARTTSDQAVTQSVQEVVRASVPAQTQPADTTSTTRLVTNGDTNLTINRVLSNLIDITTSTSVSPRPSQQDVPPAVARLLSIMSDQTAPAIRSIEDNARRGADVQPFRTIVDDTKLAQEPRATAPELKLSELSSARTKGEQSCVATVQPGDDKSTLNVRAVRPTAELGSPATVPPAEEKAPVNGRSVRPTSEQGSVATVQPGDEKAPVNGRSVRATAELGSAATLQPSDEKAPVNGRSIRATADLGSAATIQPNDEKPPTNGRSVRATAELGSAPISQSIDDKVSVPHRIESSAARIEPIDKSASDKRAETATEPRAAKGPGSSAEEKKEDKFIATLNTTDTIKGEQTSDNKQTTFTIREPVNLAPWFIVPESKAVKEPKPIKEQRSPVNTDGKAKRRRAYIVRHGDSLESIAKNELNDARYASLILTINRGTVRIFTRQGKQYCHLYPGQLLWLPSQQEQQIYSKTIFSARRIFKLEVSQMVPNSSDLPNGVKLPSTHTIDRIRKAGRKPCSLEEIESHIQKLLGRLEDAANNESVSIQAGTPAAPAEPQSKHPDSRKADPRMLRQFGESCRMICEEAAFGGAGIYESSLQCSVNGAWKTVVSYVYRHGRTYKYTYGASSGSRPFQMELPLHVVQQMASEDFSRNWAFYCDDFLNSSYNV